MKILGLPERPNFIPETLTLRLEEQENGHWIPVDDSQTAAAAQAEPAVVTVQTATGNQEQLMFIPSGNLHFNLFKFLKDNYLMYVVL